MIRRVTILAFILITQVAATAPPPVIATHVRDGMVDLTDLSWLKGALPDATVADKQAWQPVAGWIDTCMTENTERVKAELAAMGVASPAIARIPNGDLVCAAVARMLGVARRYADWPDLKAASDEADRLFATFSYGASTGAESVPFDPAWLNDDALALLHAAVREQYYRRALAWRASRDTPPVSDAVWAILQVRLTFAYVAEDHRNTAMMKAYVAGKGWPTIAKVGSRASDAAWLLVQHADDDPAFQLSVLRLMAPLAEKGEVSKANYALLYDRVMLKTLGKQRYGTQTTCADGKRVALPIEDPDKVETWRAEAGLDTMTANFARLDKLYGPCAPEAAGPLPPKK